MWKEEFVAYFKVQLDIYFFFFSFAVALQSLKDLGRLTYRFLELFRHMVGLLGRVISSSQGLYLHRTTQHRKMRTNIHALSGIRTHYSSNQPAKTHALDRTATVTDNIYTSVNKIDLIFTTATCFDYYLVTFTAPLILIHCSYLSETILIARLNMNGVPDIGTWQWLTSQNTLLW
jgi:hypothetical protein